MAGVEPNPVRFQAKSDREGDPFARLGMGPSSKALMRPVLILRSRWCQGVQGMREGGIRQLYIPAFWQSELGNTHVSGNLQVELSYDEDSRAKEVMPRAVAQEKKLGPRPSTAGGGGLRFKDAAALKRARG